MEDLAALTALNHSGSFGKNFGKVTVFTIRTDPQPVNNIYVSTDFYFFYFSFFERGQNV